MAVRPVDVRAIVERVCARPEVLDACARGDLGTVIDALWTGGLTQGRISGLTGIPQAVYRYLAQLAEDGRAVQVGWGRWRAARPGDEGHDE